MLSLEMIRKTGVKSLRFTMKVQLTHHQEGSIYTWISMRTLSPLLLKFQSQKHKLIKKIDKSNCKKSKLNFKHRNWLNSLLWNCLMALNLRDLLLILNLLSTRNNNSKQWFLPMSLQIEMGKILIHSKLLLWQHQ